MRFIKALIIFIRMFNDGFFISENLHNDASGRWGFYRFNHKQVPALFDIDLSIKGEGINYIHVHGEDCRIDLDKKGKVKDILKRTTRH